MVSKLCPKCGRVVSCNFEPKFCAWGCGKLEKEPILPAFTSYSERCSFIENLQNNLPIKKNIQLKLF